jgi:uncharacterized protein
MTGIYSYSDKLVAESKRCHADARPTHDWSHTWRVVRLCQVIGEKEKADLEILYAAALLHDIARAEADRCGVCHAELSARKARPVLAHCGFPPEKIDAVIHCIETHRFRSTAQPRSLEAQVLFDADKIDALGAIGVCRAYAFAGENGQQLYSQPSHALTLTTAIDHADYSPVVEFAVKLSRLSAAMQTKSGKEFARDRHNFMHAFFQRLQEEVEGLR